MTEEIKQETTMRVSDMIRTTANNTNNLLMQVADHIDKLEAEIVRLSLRVEQLEGNTSDSDAN